MSFQTQYYSTASVTRWRFFCIEAMAVAPQAVPRTVQQAASSSSAHYLLFIDQTLWRFSPTDAWELIQSGLPDPGTYPRVIERIFANPAADDLYAIANDGTVWQLVLTGSPGSEFPKWQQVSTVPA